MSARISWKIQSKDRAHGQGCPDKPKLWKQTDSVSGVLGGDMTDTQCLIKRQAGGQAAQQSAWTALVWSWCQPALNSSTALGWERWSPVVTTVLTLTPNIFPCAQPGAQPGSRNTTQSFHAYLPTTRAWPGELIYKNISGGGRRETWMVRADWTARNVGRSVVVAEWWTYQVPILSRLPHYHIPSIALSPGPVWEIMRSGSINQLPDVIFSAYKNWR